jgi:hypothetical protein
MDFQIGLVDGSEFKGVPIAMANRSAFHIIKRHRKRNNPFSANATGI